MKNNQPQRKALAAPAGIEDTNNAARRLGVSISQWNNHAVVLPQKERGRPQTWNAVALHRKPFDLVKAFEFMDSFSVLIQAVPRNPKLFANAIGRARMLSTNGTYNRLLDDISDWIIPNGKLGFFRRLLMWGPAGEMIPAKSEMTGAVDGFIPTYSQIGSLIAAAIHRQAFHESVGLESENVGMQPLDIAVPHAPLKKYRNHLSLNNVAFGYWKGIIDVETLPEILALDLDVYLHLERVGGDNMYVTAILRASTVMNGADASALDVIDDQLRHIGRWERVVKADLLEAFLALIPGQKPIAGNSKWMRHLVPESVDMAEEITKRLDDPGDHKGEVACGLTLDDKPYFIDPHERGTVVFVGQQQSGKTTLAATMGLMQTPAVVILQQSYVPGEAAVNWVRDMGGQVKELDLPDATNREAELELFKQDAAEAQKFVATLYQGWVQNSKATGLPLLVRPNSKTLRNSVWMYVFYQYYRQAWAHWTEEVMKKTQISVVIFDDLVGLPELESDIYLGDLKILYGKMIRGEMRTSIGTAAKQNLHIYFTLHSIDELEQFPNGFFESTTLAIELFLDKHTNAEIYDPRARSRQEKLLARLKDQRADDDTMTRNLFRPTVINVRLPNQITQVVGRKERVLA